MSAPDATKPVGAGSELVSRYRLVRLVAQGGMASVWEAHDNVLARSVAVKVLHPHLAADRLFLERFRREAVSAARLAHPNVVATFDAGITPDGTAFIVMELIRGRTLSAFADDHRPLPIFVCVEIAIQIADALAHAHGAGLVHRDIKPANVLVCEPANSAEGGGDSDGVPRVKVTDFGIAKAAEGLDLDLTKTGMIMGTPKYLSPEQVDGREPDARADLYALGVVLFEMVSGLAPFRGRTEMAVAVQHLNEIPVRLRDLRSATPPDLDILVAALLEKRPEDRPPSALAVRQVLSRIDTTNRRSPAVVRPAATVSPTTAAAAAHESPLAPAPSRNGSPVPPLSARPRRRPPTGPNWTGRMVAVLVVVALVVVVVVVVANRGSKSHRVLPPVRVTAPPIVQKIEVFHLERDADDYLNVALAIDGNLNTAWQTDRYHAPHFAGLRHGLGLALTLDSSTALHTMVVTSATPGWSAEAYVAASVADPPALAPWGLPVDTKANVSATVTTFDLHGQTGGAVLLWFTDLAPAPTLQVSIAEVAIH